MQVEPVERTALRVVIIKVQKWQRAELQQANTDIAVLQNQLETAADVYEWGRTTQLPAGEALNTLSHQLHQLLALHSGVCAHRSEIHNLVPSLRIACLGNE